jgi:hypothetical protein
VHELTPLRHILPASLKADEHQDQAVEFDPTEKIDWHDYAAIARDEQRTG